MTEERYFEVIEDYGFNNITEEENAEMHTALLYRALEGFELTANEMRIFYQTYNFVDMIENVVHGRVDVDIIYEFNGKYYRTSMYYDDYDGFDYSTATPFEEVEFKKVVIEVEKWVPKEN